VEWLSMCVNHVAINPEVKQNAQQPLEALRANLIPDQFAAAWERGKALDLDTVVAEILAKPPVSSQGEP